MDSSGLDAEMLPSGLTELDLLALVFATRWKMFPQEKVRSLHSAQRSTHKQLIASCWCSSSRRLCCLLSQFYLPSLKSHQAPTLKVDCLMITWTSSYLLCVPTCAKHCAVGGMQWRARRLPETAQNSAWLCLGAFGPGIGFMVINQIMKEL